MCEATKDRGVRMERKSSKAEGLEEGEDREEENEEDGQEGTPSLSEDDEGEITGDSPIEKSRMSHNRLPYYDHPRRHDGNRYQDSSYSLYPGEGGRPMYEDELYHRRHVDIRSRLGGRMIEVPHDDTRRYLDRGDYDRRMEVHDYMRRREDESPPPPSGGAARSGRRRVYVMEDGGMPPPPEDRMDFSRPDPHEPHYVERDAVKHRGRREGEEEEDISADELSSDDSHDEDGNDSSLDERDDKVSKYRTTHKHRKHHKHCTKHKHKKKHSSTCRHNKHKGTTTTTHHSGSHRRHDNVDEEVVEIGTEKKKKISNSKQHDRESPDKKRLRKRNDSRTDDESTADQRYRAARRRDDSPPAARRQRNTSPTVTRGIDRVSQKVNDERVSSRSRSDKQQRSVRESPEPPRCRQRSRSLQEDNSRDTRRDKQRRTGEHRRPRSPERESTRPTERRVAVESRNSRNDHLPQQLKGSRHVRSGEKPSLASRRREAGGSSSWKHDKFVEHGNGDDNTTRKDKDDSSLGNHWGSIRSERSKERERRELADKGAGRDRGRKRERESYSVDEEEYSSKSSSDSAPSRDISQSDSDDRDEVEVVETSSNHEAVRRSAKNRQSSSPVQVNVKRKAVDNSSRQRKHHGRASKSPETASSDDNSDVRNKEHQNSKPTGRSRGRGGPESKSDNRLPNRHVIDVEANETTEAVRTKLTPTEQSNPDVKVKAVDSSKQTTNTSVSLATSGKLLEDTNKVNGVIVKYRESDDARKPKTRWRLYVFKGEEELPILYIHRQSAYLMGRDRKVVEIPLDHPSCSKQHAVIQFRLVDYTRSDGTKGRKVTPYVIDLASANGTFLNNVRIQSQSYVELREKDVLKFGFSSREYVLLHDQSKDNPDDLGVDQ